jgi:hypothetical protein
VRYTFISLLKQIRNFSVPLKFEKKKKKMASLSFSKDTPNKIATGIDVSEKSTLIKTDDNGWRAAIADEPIDTKVDGRKISCVRVDSIGAHAAMMIGFAPVETFDSNKQASFGYNGFTGTGISLDSGNLWYPVGKHHKIINDEVSKQAKEIIAVLDVSNNGTKKEIRFLVDGNETKSTDVSEHLKGSRVFLTICLFEQNQKVTTIPIDQIQNKTPEIENLIKEYQQQGKTNNQSGGAFASSTSTEMIQLQRELAEELQKIADLSSQLQQEKQKSSDLEKEIQRVKQELSSS